MWFILFQYRLNQRTKKIDAIMKFGGCGKYYEEKK